MSREKLRLSYHRLLAVMLLTTVMTLSAVAGTELPAEADTTATDTVAADTTKMATPETENRDWLYLLRHGKLNMADTTVVWPRFLGFCVNVYNWGNEFFNGTDSAYVQGTGHRWKVFIKSDNWVDSYAMDFNNKMPMRMTSDMYCNAGAYLQYMAVSVGYSLDLSNIIGNKPSNHKRLEFSFSCARFCIDAYYNENTGGSYMRTFGDYKDGHLFKKQFPGLTLYNAGIDAYYFFNNRRYSQAAAYNYSRIQRKSAFSPIAGFCYSNLNISLDFTQLPASLKPFLTIPEQEYRFHYDSYNIMLGVGYNWVPRRNWVVNFTALPAIGVIHCQEDSSEGAINLLSMVIKGKIAAVYNIGDIFMGFNGRFDGNWYKSSSYSFFSSIENIAAVVGVRF